LKLAKAKAHIRDADEPGLSSTSNTPLVNCKFFLDAQAEVINVGIRTVDSDELNFQNPMSLTGELKIKQPKMLMAQLRSTNSKV
jgi:DNA helicase INO80